MPRFNGFFISLFLLTSCASVAQADASDPPAAEPSVYERSLWEAGVVGGGGYLPDYPAADENRFKWIAAPYLVYRGRIMRADRDGARARLLAGRLYEVELSAAASFAARSEDNRAREGMPDIDYMLELGPRLSFTLSRLGGLGKLRLFLPVRGVFSSDLGDFRHRGWTLTPALNARWKIGRPAAGWLAVTQLSASFGNRQLCAYFYDVQPAFVRPDRPFYDARGGYIGTDIFAGLLIPFANRLRFFTGVQGLVHSGAANQVSPLFKNHLNYSLATGLVWTFYRSPRPAVILD